MHANGKLGGLHELVDEAVDRPRVDELSMALRMVADLRIAFGDLDDRDPEIAGECRPLLARGGRGAARSQDTVEIQQGTLHEM